MTQFFTPIMMRRMAGRALLTAALIPAFGLQAAESPSPQASAQQTRKGEAVCTVLDSYGDPAIGATFMSADKKVNGASDLDGKFTANISRPTKFRVTYVGCQPMEVELVPGESKEIRLADNAELLDEMVVVGFGTQKKVNLTGSVGMATSKDIQDRPVQSAVAALQGVIPGLNISNSTSGGELNASKQINVRGLNTIGEGSSGGPLILIDGMEGDLSTINPNDIENISVLKDAAASSIYGSRAPFGVILVTTKKGAAGKARIQYSNSFRFNQPMTPMEMMDSWEYINYLNDVSRYTDNSVTFTDDFVEGAWAYYSGQSDNFIYENKWQGTSRRWGTDECAGTFANVNWRDELYKKTAFAHEHNLTLSGGSEKVTYYISGNLLDQSGFLKYGNDDYDRFQINGKVSAQMFPWLNVSYSGRWIRTDYSRPTVFSGGFYEKVIRRLVPTNPVYDPNGYIAADYNYIEHLQNGGRHKEQNDNFTNQFTLTINPLKGWNIIGEFNSKIDSDWTHEDSKPVYAHDADDLEGLSHETTHLAFDSGEHSSVYEYAQRGTYLNVNAYTDYSFSIKEMHNFKAMLGFQSESFKRRNIHASRNDMIVEDLPVLDLTSSQDSYSLGGRYDEWTTTGFFGRINYDYDSKYLLEANLRYDGSSRFKSKHRWVWSPSFSAGWNIDRENFFEPARDVVNSLKLRASYGQLANQNTNSWYPTFRTMSVENQASKWLVDGMLANLAFFPGLIDPYMTWEKVRTVNLGLDFGLFNNRLTGSFDYFWRTNKDMIGPAVEFPATLGASVPSQNSLDMRTDGWELTIGWRDNVGDWSYSVKFNLSDDRTKILKYPNYTNALKDIHETNYIPGEYVGDIYGFETIGVARDDEEMAAHLADVDQSAIGSNWLGGDIMYRDLNGDGKITKGTSLDDLGDWKKIGNTTPRFRFGLNLYAAWKGIDVSVFFQGVGKRDYYFSPYGGQGTGGKGAVFWGATVGGRWESVFLKEHLDYWRDENSRLGENRDSYYGRPLYYTNKNREVQDRFLQNAAYLRMKNLQVGYTLPKSITRKFACENLRIFFSAENLFTCTQMSKVIDPESLEVSSMKSGSSYPLAKTFSFGLNVEF